MRPLEMLIPCLLAAYLLWPFFTGKSRSRLANSLPLAALLVTLLHLLIEKYRWQMVPLYALVAVCAVPALIGLIKPRPHPFKRSFWSAAGLFHGLLVILVCTALPVLLPVPRVPAASGPYRIGTTTLVLVDESRREIYSGDPTEPREFIVQIWYPAQPDSTSKRAPWMADADVVAPSLADYLKLPHFFLDHLSLVRTNAYTNAPADPSGGPYPLLLFSHGWNGFRAQNAGLFQELVSNGYVVASIEHTYSARITVFPDGKIADNNPDILPQGASNTRYDAAARLLLEQWTADTVYTLDTLTALNAGDPQGIFTGLLDLEKIGAFGHSTGGGAAIQFCVLDPRCQAVFGMDAWMTPVSPQVLERGSDRPMLFLFSEVFPTVTNWRLFDKLADNLDGPLSVATILGTAHYDFTDLPLLSPLAPQLRLKGPLEGIRVIQIVNDYALGFFDWALKGLPSSLPSGLSPAYPELIFRRRP